MNITTNDGTPAGLQFGDGATFSHASGALDSNTNGGGGPRSGQTSNNQSMSLIHTSTLTSQFAHATAGAVAIP